MLSQVVKAGSSQTVLRFDILQKVNTFWHFWMNSLGYEKQLPSLSCYHISRLHLNVYVYKLFFFYVANLLDSQTLKLSETKETIKCCFLSSHLFQGGKTLERLSFQFSSWTPSISSLWYIQEILMWQEWESNLKITGNTDTSTSEAFLSGKPQFFPWSPLRCFCTVQDHHCGLGIVVPILQTFESSALFSHPGYISSAFDSWPPSAIETKIIILLGYCHRFLSFNFLEWIRKISRG